MATLQQRPEAFDAVGVGHVPNKLTDRVINGQVVETSAGKWAIAAKFIGNYGCASRRIGSNEANQSSGLRVGNRHCANLATLVAHTDYRSFPDCAPTTVQLLICMFVAFFAANIGFIHLDVIAHIVILAILAFQPSFADTLGKKPSRLLGDAQFARHLG